MTRAKLQRRPSRYHLSESPKLLLKLYWAAKVYQDQRLLMNFEQGQNLFRFSHKQAIRNIDLLTSREFPYDKNLENGLLRELRILTLVILSYSLKIDIQHALCRINYHRATDRYYCTQISLLSRSCTSQTQLQNEWKNIPSPPMNVHTEAVVWSPFQHEPNNAELQGAGASMRMCSPTRSFIHTCTYTYIHTYIESCRGLAFLDCTVYFVFDLCNVFCISICNFSDQCTVISLYVELDRTLKCIHLVGCTA